MPTPVAPLTCSPFSPAGPRIPGSPGFPYNTAWSPRGSVLAGCCGSGHSRLCPAARCPELLGPLWHRVFPGCRSHLRSPPAVWGRIHRRLPEEEGAERGGWDGVTGRGSPPEPLQRRVLTFSPLGPAGPLMPGSPDSPGSPSVPGVPGSPGLPTSPWPREGDGWHSAGSTAQPHGQRGPQPPLRPHPIPSHLLPFLPSITRLALWEWRN